MNHRKTAALFLLVLIPIAGLVALYSYYSSVTGGGSSVVGTEGPCYNVTLVISYGKDYGYGINQTFSGLNFPSGTTAFGVLLENARVNYTYYGSLVLVTGINGVFNNATTNLFWQYYVDGVFAPVASNVYHLANNSAVEWLYQTSRFT